MRRQRSAKANSSHEAPKATKTLGVRYAELLKLREAVERTQSNSKLLSPVEFHPPEARSCVLISLGWSICSPLLWRCLDGPGCCWKDWLGHWPVEHTSIDDCLDRCRCDRNSAAHPIQDFLNCTP